MTPAHGPDTADTSVVSAVVEFRGGSAMIPASRDVVHGFVTRLSERGLDLTDAFLDAARLVASELVTNALRHAPALPAGADPGGRPGGDRGVGHGGGLPHLPAP